LIQCHDIPDVKRFLLNAYLHINNVNAYHVCLKQWLINGVATKNLPNDLGGRRALEAWGNHPANLDQSRYRQRVDTNSWLS
jgi:hypothetical protein